MNKNCIICNEVFYKKPTVSKKEWESVTRFCSRKCKGQYWSDNFSGKNNPTFKGTQYLGKNGYYVICRPEGGRVLVHRYVMEKHLGRRLKSLEYVHHINHIKTDNRLENLQLMSRREHNMLHYPKGSYFGIHSKRNQTKEE